MNTLRAGTLVSLLLGNLPVGCGAQGQPEAFAAKCAAEAKANYAFDRVLLRRSGYAAATEGLRQLKG